MKITISGMLGSGKSTIAKVLAKKLHLKHYSSGDFMRQMASERGITLAELSKIAENDPEIDKEIDQRQINLGKNQDKFIIDGRLSWKFIPDSIKIYLDVSPEESARRTFNDKKETRKTEKFSSIKELAKQIEERKKSEIKRYKKYYGVNHHDKKHYDLYLDTTKMTIKEEVDYLLKKIKKISEKNNI
jgi:cytidylate kinase